MKGFLFACSAFAMASVALERVSARQLSCPGIMDGEASPLVVDQFYAERAVSIVRAGLNDDLPLLDTLVAKTAKFAIWRGDYSTSGRQSGVLGVLEMIRDLNPTRFQTTSIQPGPISVAAPKCKWSTTILFRTEQPALGVTMKFDFVDGLLVQATGNQVALSEGSVRQPPLSRR